MNDTKRSFGEKFSNKHIALEFTKERYDTHTITRLSIRFIWILGTYILYTYLCHFQQGKFFACTASEDSDNIKANAS